jgi:putative FmdB family regulatory protein
MPIYEYACVACGHRLEALQKISDAPLTDCPECKKAELKKQVSAAGFRLSGGGWYETDFKSGDKKKNVAGEKTVAPTATVAAPTTATAPATSASATTTHTHTSSCKH